MSGFLPVEMSGSARPELVADRSSFTAWNMGDRAICQGGAVPAHTAVVYEAINYGGSCAVLRAGKYPHPAWKPGEHGTKGNFGITNDTLTSIRLGPNTTIRL